LLSPGGLLILTRKPRSLPAMRRRLERMCQLLDKDPIGQFCYRWLHFPRNGGRNRDAGVKPPQEIEPANLSKRD
jgi:hypothetical protein